MRLKIPSPTSFRVRCCCDKWWIAQQVRHQHCREARAEQWQKQCEACRHLSNQDDTGDRSPHDGGEKCPPANHVECRWILSHVGKPSVVKSAKEKTALRPQDKHGRVPAAIKSVLDGAGSATFFAPIASSISKGQRRTCILDFGPIRGRRVVRSIPCALLTLLSMT